MNPKHTPASERGLTQEYVFQRLSYDPETGHLTRKMGPMAGRPAGGMNINGAIQVSLGGVLYLAHRLIWFMAHGSWPTEEIDHINGDRSDNRIANLRDVPATINAQNKRRATRHNKLSIMGVRQSRNGRYQAILRVDGKPRGLGAFDTPEEAHLVYLEAKRRHHLGCTI